MTHMIACPECGQSLQVPAELIGTAVQCPKCQHAFNASLPADGKDTPAAAPPAKRKERRSRHDNDDGDEMPPPRIKIDKPAHVTGLGVMAVVGGIGAILIALAWGAGTVGVCCLWPGTYYSLVIGILAVVRGSALLAANAHDQPLPRTLAILMIVNIINGDIVCLALGIIMLTFCGEQEVIDYLKKPA